MKNYSSAYCKNFPIIKDEFQIVYILFCELKSLSAKYLYTFKKYCVKHLSSINPHTILYGKLEFRIFHSKTPSVCSSIIARKILEIY